MTDPPPEAPVDPGALGVLLVRLHEAAAPTGPLEVSYRIWNHLARTRAAVIADLEERERRGASLSFISASSNDRDSDQGELEEIVRIWRDGERSRIEHHGGSRDGYYAVTEGPLWWVWDERNGAHSNQDDPNVLSNIGTELQIMLNPIPLLSSLRFTPIGHGEIAGRPTISARAIPRENNARHGMAFELHELGTGADSYALEIDRHSGVLLAVASIREGQPYRTITTLSLAFGEPIADATFRFEPPAGEQIQSRFGQERVRNVTLVEAQQQAPFTVLMPDSVPATWQVRCRLILPSMRPPAPTQVGLTYTSVDGHESVSLSQFPAGGTNPYRELGAGEDWETVTRDGQEMKTRPARWSQAQVELERDGTFVHLMSDNLTRDQVLGIAAGLRPAPTTSSL